MLSVLIFGSIGLLLISNNADIGSSVNNTATTAKSTEPNRLSDSTSTSLGKYIDYSTDIVSNDKGTKILFFHAPWCPQCRALDTDIKQNKIPNGITIYKTDYDTNQKLRQKYGVTIQTTFVKIDDQGNLVKKYTAYDDPSFPAISQHIL